MQINNRKAHYNYAITEQIEAGVVLLGSEVKSVREGKANISESYVADIKGELFLINANISKYHGANKFNHEPTRQRKLLLKKKEVNKLLGKINKEGFSAVPISIDFKKRFIKVLIGIGKGKKLHDKRETIKKREVERSIRREIE
jgi:SsrA-binding protein